MRSARGGLRSGRRPRSRCGRRLGRRGRRWNRGLGGPNPIGMFGDVVLGVLHHDQVAGKVTVGREPTLKDDRDPGLEELGWVAAVDHRHRHAVVGDDERGVLAGLVYAWLDGALDAETVAAEF